MNLQEFIQAFRAASERQIEEQAARILGDRAESFEAYLTEWGRYRGFIEMRAFFDETVKKAFE